MVVSPRLLSLGVLWSYLSSDSRQVQATFTIGAFDSATQQLGAAGTSCVRESSLYEETYFSVPGKALMLAQAMLSDREQVLTKGGELLEEGTAPEDIISALTDPSLDGETFIETPLYELRQYGIVDVEGRVAAYTGAGLGDLYESSIFKIYGSAQAHTTGQTEGDDGRSLTYTAQGNVVTNETVPLLESTFINATGGCGLVDRLLEAVEAVAISGNGDMRCTNTSHTAWVTESIPGASAYLHVENPDGSVLVHIDVIGDGTFNPVESLREQYNAWRLVNPCGNETTSAPIEKSSSDAVATSGNIFWGLGSSFIGFSLAFL